MSVELMYNPLNIDINKSVDVDYKILFEKLQREYKILENQFEDILIELIELKRNK